MGSSSSSLSSDGSASGEDFLAAEDAAIFGDRGLLETSFVATFLAYVSAEIGGIDSSRFLRL
jgi:hypothetical protein